MLKNRNSILTFAFSAMALLAGLGCVSVNLGSGEAERSKNVSLITPGVPFAPMKAQGADRAWQNTRNGNTIGYHSSCDSDLSPDLQMLQKDLESEFKDLKTLNQKTQTYNSREALFSEVEGKVEGVPTRMSSVVFRKNSCSFYITLVGLGKTIEQDREQFQRFVDGFKAP